MGRVRYCCLGNGIRTLLICHLAAVIWTVLPLLIFRYSRWVKTSNLEERKDVWRPLALNVEQSVCLCVTGREETRSGTLTGSDVLRFALYIVMSCDVTNRLCSAASVRTSTRLQLFWFGNKRVFKHFRKLKMFANLQFRELLLVYLFTIGNFYILRCIYIIVYIFYIFTLVILL